MMRNGALALTIGLLAASTACGSGEEVEPLASLSVETKSAGANRAPVIRELRIDPQRPTVRDSVRATVSVFDPDGDPVEVEYSWWVDGDRLESTASEPGDLDLSVGTLIEVAATASDGRLQSDRARFEAEVVNRPPRLTGLGISPAQKVYPGKPIIVTPAGEDPDGNPVTYRFEWFVNDELSDQWESSFSTAGLSQGDRVRVSVVVSDGTADGTAMESEDVIVSGAHPEITSMPPGDNSDSAYRYEVVAADPDGDKRLRFRLPEAPAGMTIDPVLGVIEWTPTIRQSGTHQVSVAVVDSSGLETTQTFEVNVSKAPPASADE